WAGETGGLAGRFLLDALAPLEGALGFLCYVLLKLAGSPSGRYAAPRSAFRLRARAAWAGQELPSLAVPLLACAERLSLWPNCILLTTFLIHYATGHWRPSAGSTKMPQGSPPISGHSP
uniref:Uncharacterized protein n=1 Tax=Balaenoptera musculus TaxID=9771 RepID=A0A8C0CA21_BALMU